jgi:SEC-C motif-containing protein
VSCICGLGESTETCCGPIIKGERLAPTAEALMRSRYTAYVLGEVDYILGSLHPDHRADVDRDATAAWSKSADWKGLEIIATEGGGESDEKGVVEFKARFELNGAPQVHHERAHFEKQGSRWYFVDGDIVGQKPVVREGPRIGRNDPCHCGSGKKYKKCHGKAA